jgi:hypothetical protein
MNTLATIGRRLLRGMLKKTLLASVGIFFLVALFVGLATGIPAHAIFMTMISGGPGMSKLLLPLAGLVGCWIGAGIWFIWWRLPRHFRECREDVDRLMKPATPYQESIWKRIRGQVADLISRSDLRVNHLSYPHLKNHEKVDRFISEDLKRYFSVNRRVESDVEALDGDVLPDEFEAYDYEYEEEMPETVDDEYVSQGK